jgi:acyl-CoA thioesterase
MTVPSAPLDSTPCSVADRFATALGLTAAEASPDLGRAEMLVTTEHLNPGARAHGGAIFSLADAAVALAANTDGVAVVAASHIQFLEGAAAGDRLVAVAALEYRRGRRAAYRVRVTRGDELIAYGTSETQRIKE